MRPTGRREVRRHDQWHAPQSKRSDHREPDRTTAEDHRGPVSSGSRSVNGVEPYGNRFGQRRQLRIDATGNGKHAIGMHEQALRERSRQVIRIAEGNDPAGPAGNGMGDDRRVGTEAGDACSHLDDPARELVPEHHVGVGVEVEETEASNLGRLDEIVGIPARVQISSADPARDRLEEHVSRKHR